MAPRNAHSFTERLATHETELDALRRDVKALQLEVNGPTSFKTILQGLIDREKNTGAYMQFLVARAAARQEKK